MSRMKRRKGDEENQDGDTFNYSTYKCGSKGKIIKFIIVGYSIRS